MTLSPNRLVRVLVVVVAVECAVALVAGSTSAWQIFNGEAGRSTTSPRRVWCG